MRYLLDTNILSRIYDKSATGHDRILRALASLRDDDEVSISILTLHELEYGLANAPEAIKAVVQRKISQAKSDFEIVDIPVAGAPIFGRLKVALRDSRAISAKNLQRHTADLLLAGTCIAEQRVLVSSDAIFIELARLDAGLVVEDWTISA